MFLIEFHALIYYFSAKAYDIFTIHRNSLPHKSAHISPHVRAVGPYGSPRFLRKPVHSARIRFQGIRRRDYECTHIDLSFSINKKVYIMICPEDSAEKYRIFVLPTWFAHCCVLITRRQRENGATKIKSFEFYHLADEQCPAGEC